MRETDEPRITWEADLPLFSRRMLSQWSLMIVVTAGIMAGLLAVIFAAQGEWTSLLPMAGMVVAACLGLWLLGLGIMAVLFRGRYRVRYTVSGRGITCEQLERVSRVSNRLAIVAGAAAGRANLAGAGLIAASRELEEIRVEGAFRAVFDPAHARIILRNAWRTLMWVQCTPATTRWSRPPSTCRCGISAPQNALADPRWRPTSGGHCWRSWPPCRCSRWRTSSARVYSCRS